MAEIVPVPLPEGVTVHHVWSLVAVQLVLEVTEKEVLPKGYVTDCVAGVTESVGAACVTVTVTGDAPVAETVTVATLCEVVVLVV